MGNINKYVNIYLFEQKTVIQSCDRPINTICRRQQKKRQFQLLPRERKKFLHIPEGRQMLLASKKKTNKQTNKQTRNIRLKD